MGIIIQYIDPITDVSLNELGGINVYKEYKKILIGVEPDLNRLAGYMSDPYFKLSYDVNFKNPAKVARISMKSGCYVYHGNVSADVSPMGSELNTIFRAATSDGQFPGLSIWDALLSAIEYISRGTAYHKDLKTLKEEFPNLNLDFNHIQGTPPAGHQVIKWGKAK